MIRLLRLLGDRLSLYLPLILMGVLALGTYWLVRSTPLLMPITPTPFVSHEPDYFMHKFSIKTFDAAGQLKNEVMGSEVRHFPDTDTLEIDLVKIRSLSDAGSMSTASANRAVANSDASQVELIGDARVVREQMQNRTELSQPDLEFRGEYLQVSTKTERVKSNQPVQLARGNDRFRADTMQFDNVARVLELKGGVKGILIRHTDK